jgi:hypothetical protein
MGGLSALDVRFGKGGQAAHGTKSCAAHPALCRRAFLD